MLLSGQMWTLPGTQPGSSCECVICPVSQVRVRSLDANLGQHMPTRLSNRLSSPQPVNFDFPFERLELLVAGDEFSLPFLCQRGRVPQVSRFCKVPGHPLQSVPRHPLQLVERDTL